MTSEKPSEKRATPAIKAFQKGAFDTIYPAGEIINVHPEDASCYIVREGSVAAEMLVPAPDGLKKIELDTIEAGEYFNIHALFGFKLENQTDLRYRAQGCTAVMRVTLDMLPKDPKKLFIILRSFMQTSARREDKLRQLTGYATQRAEEKKADRKNGDLLFMQSLHEKIEELNKRLKTIENTNAVLRRAKQALESELRSAKDALDFERRTRQALEMRSTELTKQLALRDKTISQSKFPAASYLLESRELQDLEVNSKRFHQAAEHFEDLARKLHRAFELLAEDNPNMLVSEDVMTLMTGEEPPPRPSVARAKASRRDSDTRARDIVADDQVTEPSKKNPRQTDRQFSENKQPKKLSQVEVESILEEFVKNTSTPDSLPPSSNAINAPHPNQDLDMGGERETMPYIPDENHPAINADIEIPPASSAPIINDASSPTITYDFSEDEPDSDITPVVPEYPGYSTHGADSQPIEFPDEGTDVRQIQEDWREKLRAETPKSKKTESLSDAEWVDSSDIRTTKAYQFPAPGKPPKPES